MGAIADWFRPGAPFTGGNAGDRCCGGKVGAETPCVNARQSRYDGAVSNRDVDPTEADPPSNPGSPAESNDPPTGAPPDATVEFGAGVPLREGDETIVSFSGAEPSPAADVSVPNTIGSYRIVRELGRGGMGLVYVGEDLRLGRQIALKILPQHLASDPTAFQRFKDEARLLAQMNHPNIATIHSLESEESVHFLTMELISGETLSARLASGPLLSGEWFVVSRQIASALEAAHANGIIHLDLKPANVMLTPDGIVKVLDFGLAMAPGRETDAGEGMRTRARTQEAVSGTPGYMSPEQAMGKSVDSRADVFAFGSVFYEMVTGSPTFVGSNLVEKMRATLTVEPDLSVIPAEIPEGVRELIRRCLVKDPQRRLASITQAIEEIDRSLKTGRPDRTRITPNNLPISLSKFIGREQAKADAKALLQQNVMLSVTGVGGGGKTRFALEVGRDLLPEFPDGVWQLQLAQLADASRVADELRSVLSVKEEPGRDPVDTLIDHLAHRSTLLLLDGCERFLEATAALVNRLLSRCAKLRILNTSREPLGVNGEAIYQLPLLGVPRAGSRTLPVADLEAFEAIQFFVDRANAVKPGFKLGTDNAEAIVQICQRLDGIPLALELAAARIRVLAPADIARRLDDRFRLLTSTDRGVLPYHQTLRALIDWSHDHLAPAEQMVFRRLAVFAGGWTLEAAERICTGPDLDEWELLDHLSSLVEKSLVEMDSDASQRTGRTRYRMLETIRAYARQRLEEANEVGPIRDAHRALFVTLAEEGEKKLIGLEQSTWLTRLAEDHDNFRVALDVEGANDDLTSRLQLAGALGRYWQMLGHWTEGRTIYKRLLDEAPPPETAGTASALNWAGNLSKSQSDYPSAKAYLERSLELHRRLADPAGVARSVHNLGNVLKDLGDNEGARAMYLEGLTLQESLGNRASVALSYNGLGAISLQERDHASARSHFERSLAIRRELGIPGAIADSLNNVGLIAVADGRLEDAVVHYEESLSIYRDLGSRAGVAAALHNLGGLAKKRQQPDRAVAYYQESLSIHRELGDRRGTATTVHGLAHLHFALGNLELARPLFLESATILSSIGDRPTLRPVLQDWAALIVSLRQPRRAARLLGLADTLRPASSPEGASVPSSDAALLAREQLGESLYQQQFEAGRSMTISEAIALAGSDSRADLAD